MFSTELMETARWQPNLCFSSRKEKHLPLHAHQRRNTEVDVKTIQSLFAKGRLQGYELPENMSIMMPYGEYGGKCGYCHGPDRRSISFGTIAHTIRRSNDGSVGLRAAKLRVDDFQELLDMYAKFAKINPLPLHFQEDGADLALGCTNRTTKLYFFLIFTKLLFIFTHLSIQIVPFTSVLLYPVRISQALYSTLIICF